MLLKNKSLPADILQITCEKATERPFTGQYDKASQVGSYCCRLCGLALYRSITKFHSGCGWPSFDEEIPGAVKHQTDRDGQRTEILCNRCNAHLGHIFHGEHFTNKNTRHCVNSASLDFVNDPTVEDTEEAIFAAGCFWGVEYYFKKLAGVVKTEVGYIGGTQENPTYQQVCAGNTGHVEAIRILFNPKIISYQDVTKYFFEIHDPTQANGQGPDLGPQYLGVIFYYDTTQQKIAERLLTELSKNGFKVATRILPMSIFWKAEDYHQDYYAVKNGTPYCHYYIKRFNT